MSFFVTLRANFVNMLCLNKENPEPPLMAGQTADHLQAGPPFSKLGVDFFEPLKKSSSGAEEIRLHFTCLLTTGVPLGVVHSLSTNSFIMCLWRFITKRHKPTDIYPYNGTNFVGSNLEIQECLDNWNQGKIASIKEEFRRCSILLMQSTWGSREHLVRSC